MPTTEPLCRNCGCLARRHDRNNECRQCPGEDCAIYDDYGNPLPDGVVVREIHAEPCRCDGRYMGCDHPKPCPTPGGGRWSPYFCPACDTERVAHISRNLDAIVQGAAS